MATTPAATAPATRPRSVAADPGAPAPAPAPESRLLPWALVAPAGLFLTVFVVGPLLLVAVLALLRVDLLTDTIGWAGTGNVVDELGDPEFTRALANTLLYGLVTVPLSVGLGLGAAWLIHGLPGGAFWRGAYFLPAACTLVAMASVWRWMFAADVGVVDRVVGPVLGVRDWLGDPGLALGAIAVVGVWHQVGLVTVVYLAALAAVPTGMQDSALLDGAGPWSRLRHVIWPALAPTTVFAVVLTTANALQAYDTIAAMTRGGPLGATETLTYLIWVRGIEYFDVGRAAVLSLVLLGLSALVALAQRSRWGRRFEGTGAR